MIPSLKKQRRAEEQTEGQSTAEKPRTGKAGRREKREKKE
jgi:hypothetical protein